MQGFKFICKQIYARGERASVFSICAQAQVRNFWTACSPQIHAYLCSKLFPNVWLVSSSKFFIAKCFAVKRSKRYLISSFETLIIYCQLHIVLKKLFSHWKISGIWNQMWFTPHWQLIALQKKNSTNKSHLWPRACVSVRRARGPVFEPSSRVDPKIRQVKSW